MAGTDTVRGIHYQSIRSVLTALSSLDDPAFSWLRVEGIDDLYDIEVYGHDDELRLVQQIKTRRPEYSWSKGDVRALLTRWAALKPRPDARFEFVTNGRLGEELAGLLSSIPDVQAIEQGFSVGAIAANDDQLSAVAAAAKVVVDSASEGELFDRAVAQVKARLIGVRSDLDATENATALVNAFYRTVISRSSNVSPDDRILSRHEIGELLHIETSPASGAGWEQGLRDEYLRVASTRPEDPKIANSRFELIQSGRVDSNALADFDFEQVVGSAAPSIVVAPTGSGKSTAAGQLRTSASKRGAVVIVLRAEAYQTGRFATLVQMELENFLGRPVPVHEARAALADQRSTIVIDGASEIPRGLRDALSEDLRSIFMGGIQRPAFVLVGRNLAPMRAILPSASEPRLLRLRGLSESDQLAIAVAVLNEDADASAVVAEIQKTLIDGSTSPLLFRLALEDRNFNGRVENRAKLYERILERIFERVGAQDFALALSAAGLVFADLLDQGSRSTDRITWEQKLRSAASALSPEGGESEVAMAQQALARSGLVVELGYSQTMVPAHDSFADYLAGRAHATGQAAWPPELTEQDEERLSFANELAALQADEVEKIARRVPELLPRLARRGSQPKTSLDPIQCEQILTLLVPDFGPIGMFCDSTGRRWAVFLPTGPSRALTEDEGVKLIRRLGGIQLASDLVSCVSTLWQFHLSRKLDLLLRTSSPLGAASTAAELASGLERHTQSTASEVLRIVDETVPQQMRTKVLYTIGPLGVTFDLYHEPLNEFSAWPLIYRSSIETKVSFEPNAKRVDDLFESSFGQTDALYYLRKSPAATAASLVQDALNQLALPNWL